MTTTNQWADGWDRVIAEWQMQLDRAQMRQSEPTLEIAASNSNPPHPDCNFSNPEPKQRRARRTRKGARPQ